MQVQPEPYFIRKSYPLKGSKRLAFFFTAYGSKSWWFRNTYKRLHKLGYSVIAYQFPGSIVTRVDGDYTTRLKHIMLDDVKDQVTQHRHVEEFVSFGASMGSVYSIGFAKEIPEIKKMVMVTAYGGCAQQVWDTPVLKKTKDIYDKRGWTVEDVFNAYPEIEPVIGIEKLKGKDMLLYASYDDTLIRLENTNLFISAAKDAGLSLEVILGHGNHMQFIVKTLVKDKRWQEFLK